MKVLIKYGLYKRVYVENEDGSTFRYRLGFIASFHDKKNAEKAIEDSAFFDPESNNVFCILEEYHEEKK